jgi:hypothetical protein
MCLKFQDQSIVWVKLTGAFIREEKMVDEGIEEVMRLQMDELI